MRIFGDSNAIGDWGKVYDKSVSLRSIIDWALEKAAARALRGLIFKRVESCVSADALDRRDRELDKTLSVPSATPRAGSAVLACAFARRPHHAPPSVRAVWGAPEARV